MSSIRYTVDLTEEEAVALAMIAMSTVSGHSELTGPIAAVSVALTKADPKLFNKQLALWKQLGRPTFTFGTSNSPVPWRYRKRRAEWLKQRS